MLVAAVAGGDLCAPRGGARAQATAPPTSIGKGEGQLNLIAWEGYAQPQWVKPFERRPAEGEREVRGLLERDGLAHAPAAGGTSTTWCRRRATRTCA